MHVWVVQWFVSLVQVFVLVAEMQCCDGSGVPLGVECYWGCGQRVSG